MENTLENKAKFFAQYWGQTITSFNEINLVTRDRTIPCPVDIVYLCFPLIKYGVLNLKPLSAIADEEVEYITGIWSKGAQHPSTKDETINLLDYYASRDYATMAHDIVDYLRSKGYALPFMGLSVESQISYGWVKLAEVC